MANREALRELQTRLASRLQAARAEGVSVAWLAVRVGGRNLLFPLGQSGEIFPLSSLQVVPYARDWFRGVLNIRGGLYGVVDLAAFIAIDTGHARAEPAGQEPSVVTLNTALDVNCALQVDGLLHLPHRRLLILVLRPTMATNSLTLLASSGRKSICVSCLKPLNF